MKLRNEAAKRNLNAVELLVEHGPDVQERDTGENTPLHLAAETGNTEGVRFLVECWPEGKDALNNNGETPLLMFEHASHKLQVSDEEKRRLLLCWAAWSLRPISND
jgi:ankyrin repeat protein